MFQFNDSSLSEMEMSELDISVESASSSPSPRLPVSRREQKDWRSLRRKADDDDQDIVYKTINDNVHGHIDIHPLCQSIIDTPQFDRLRSLRQLGSAHYVFPTAKHSRWEHSLGVMHLSGEMMDHLMRVRPGCADEKDKLCVMIAGLCHDLGHGPFSHLWESFVREARPDCDWTHEKTSIEILQHLIDDNNLGVEFGKYGLDDNDITFIKELIYGPFQKGQEDGYVGRGPEKRFLYEIVANKISSVDVDKWDYMLRDSLALSIGVTFDYKRFIKNTDLYRPEEEDGCVRMQIRDKEAESVQDMFMDRARLHNRGYQHGTVLIIDRMILDALLSADDYFPIVTATGDSLKLSEACDNIEAFLQLTDDFIMRSIQFSRIPELTNAQSTIKNIIKRKLYKKVGTVEGSGGFPIPLDVARKELDRIVERSDLDNNGMTILRKRVNMGMGDKNPVERMLFFGKNGKTKTFTSDQLRKGLPREFNSETYLFICRETSDTKFRTAKECYKAWTNKCLKKKDMNLSVSDF